MITTVQQITVISEIASTSPQRDFIDAEYDSEILTGANQLFAAAEQGYNPVKFELLRNYRRGQWVGVYKITFEKTIE